MTKFRFASAAAALGLGLGLLAAGSASAQVGPNPSNGYVIRHPSNSPFANVSNFRSRSLVNLTPAFQPCYTAPGAVAALGPCSGPRGSRITVQRLKPTSTPFAMLVFRAVVSRGVPAQVRVMLSGGPNTYSAPVPQQLCMQGGGTWEVILLTANLQNQGTIGSFTPVGCP